MPRSFMGVAILWRRRDRETQVTEDYMESDNGFTGKIVQVTITIQDMKPVDKATEEKEQEILGQDRAEN